MILSKLTADGALRTLLVLALLFGAAAAAFLAGAAFFVVVAFFAAAVFGFASALVAVFFVAVLVAALAFGAAFGLASVLVLVGPASFTGPEAPGEREKLATTATMRRSIDWFTEHTLRAGEDAALGAALQSLVELGREGSIANAGEVVVCLDVFLDGLAAREDDDQQMRF